MILNLALLLHKYLHLDLNKINEVITTIYDA